MTANTKGHHAHSLSDKVLTEDLGEMGVGSAEIWTSLRAGRALHFRCEGCEKILQVSLYVDVQPVPTAARLVIPA